ncbi:GMC family oxidoreductase [Flaviramulus sp. BrNp1-15]|uniref:GMC oxidoreductase n=1 Tax=Flaviramulus sp. BrNp1-15 TaxID=2916754 RepID=UPI001EE96BE6|nr:GMC family oxidoreductase [Flaviramulus sp. BrNp1-15]ULC60855.1 GMC family oxidoreductase [Flaviramulus sp. BrNp1-15]
MSTFYYSSPLQEYDAIVVGTGISGGWAAKELCEKGLKTLVLERGPMVNHITDYPTMGKDPWDFKHRSNLPASELNKQIKQSRTGYTINEASAHWFVDDEKHPYNEVKRFDWIRGYHVGGRSLMWARQSYRIGDLDFEANVKEGIGIDWPVRYKDIKPWYDYVENFIGVSGENLGLPQLPDGNFLPPMPLNCVEDHLKNKTSENYNDRLVTISRTANLTGGEFEGRSSCQFRNRCIRGCPFGAYFSSNSSTLPAAERTGNMTLRPNSIVHEVMYDKDSKKATGVKVIDSETKETIEFKAKIIFLCASTVASTSILMQSKSETFPNGMGNESGELGHNIMDHHFRAGARAKVDGFEDKYYKGRRPTTFYIPRFQNLGGTTNKKDFLRGYGLQGGASRTDWTEAVGELNYGKDLKKAILEPGNWQIGMTGFGETLPDHRNKFYLDYDKKDQWGLPTVTFDAEYRENEVNMRKDMIVEAMDIFEKAGFKDVTPDDRVVGFGLGIHEMGTARMGHSPKTSVVNKHNQLHNVKNVFVTDGSFMTSSACQNPSLTYMAFTARAVDFAVKELKKMNL